jgi:predicted ATPase
MLVELYMWYFKSFREARLPLAELTVLIGANASGKSNLIEALRLLSWLAKGHRLSELNEILDVVGERGEKELDVRGSVAQLLREGSDSCKLGVSLETRPSEHVEVSTMLKLREEGFHVWTEQARLRIDGNIKEGIYRADRDKSQLGRVHISVDFPLPNGGPLASWPTSGSTQQPIFVQLAAMPEDRKQLAYNQAAEAARRLQAELSSIQFLDPLPRKMRGYSMPRSTTTLAGHGGNLSAVLYVLCEKQERKSEVLDFVRSLPEQEITDISFLETPRKDVMLQLTESFGGQERNREAAVLSDGTLRVLSVAAALLSAPEGTLVVIEEIDNGIHPKRAEMLIDNIYRVAKDRKLRVLLTTHNPALLDALPNEVLPNVVACYRDPQEGDSRLVRLTDLEDYPALVAQGPLGYLLAQGIVERYVRFPKTQEQKEEELRQFLERLRNPEVEP